MTCAYVAAESNSAIRHRLGHPSIVDDPCLLYPQARQTGHVRLTFPDLIRSNTCEADPVLAATFLERRQARKLLIAHRHNQLSASLGWYVLVCGESVHGLESLATQLRL